MGTIRGIRPDGTELRKRVSAKTDRLMIREGLATIDISGITDGTALTVFEVGFPDGVAPFDLTPLAGLGALEQVALECTSAFSLAPFAECTALRSLGIRLTSDEGIDLAPLAGHPTLQRLSLSLKGAPALDLAPLASIEGLEGLSVSGGAWSRLDLGPLAALPLRQLTLDSARLDQIALHPVARPSLEYLSLMKQAFTDLDTYDLRTATSLATLNLGGNELASLDLTGLAGLASLTRVYWPNVKHLHLEDGTEVRSPAVAAFLGR
ncbi:MAG: hypothetical protein R3F61_33735 [Myxococcota bacterium]